MMASCNRLGASTGRVVRADAGMVPSIRPRPIATPRRAETTRITSSNTVLPDRTTLEPQCFPDRGTGVHVVTLKGRPPDAKSGPGSRDPADRDGTSPFGEAPACKQRARRPDSFTPIHSWSLDRH